MFLTVLLFFVATFGLVSAVVIAYRFLLEWHDLAGDRNRDGNIAWVEPRDLLKSDSLSSISFWDNVLARVDYVEIMKVRIAEAGLQWSVGRLTALMLLVGAIALGILAHVSGTPWWMTLGGAIVASLVPYMYVLALRRRRLETFESQFPDALDSLGRALRAGHPLAASMQLLAEEAAEPLSQEIRVTVRERALGLSWDQALDNLARRVPLVEVSTFVAAVKLQNRTGGKLSEILTRLAETIRESVALKGEVRAISAHGKLTGGVLTILPIGIACVMAVVNPTYLALLWTRPAGQLMIGGAAFCLLLAHFVIRKMVDIRV
jgi:tight adherence protein B